MTQDGPDSKDRFEKSNKTFTPFTNGVITPVRYLGTSKAARL